MTDQIAYGPDLARLYDAFYSSKPYGEEARFIGECFGELGVPPNARILDLACGTGAHSLELAALGYQMVGVDRAQDMLKEAQRKAHDRGLSAEFLCQDLRLLNVGEEEFDAAICLFDSLGYLLNDSDIQEVLARINRSLKPGGTFAVEVWHEAAMLNDFDPVRVRRFQLPGGEVVRISETTIDVESESATINYTIFRQSSDGRWDSFCETHRNRFFMRPGIERLLVAAEFEPCRWLSGFSEEPISMQTWHIVVICRKAAAK